MIIHQNQYDIEDLCQLLIGGAICHGHPLDPHNWELPHAFFDRYGYLMGEELMRYKYKVWPKKNSHRNGNFGIVKYGKSSSTYLILFSFVLFSFVAN